MLQIYKRFVPIFETKNEIYSLLLNIDGNEIFFFSNKFDTEIINFGATLGLFPMTIQLDGHVFFTFKLHSKRAVTILNLTHSVCTLFNNQLPESINTIISIRRSTKKKIKKYSLILNNQLIFNKVCKEIFKQHGEYWLTYSLRVCFYQMFLNNSNKIFDLKIHCFGLIENQVDSHVPTELNIISGELGYSFGRIYTSLTGFYKVTGAGSILLQSIKLLLHNLNYDCWDLGMDMPYKQNMLHTQQIAQKKWLEFCRHQLNESNKNIKPNDRDIFNKIDMGFHTNSPIYNKLNTFVELNYFSRANIYTFNCHILLDKYTFHEYVKTIYS